MPDRNGQCARPEDFERIFDRLDHIEKDLWHGNGKRGLTTRAQTAEDRLDRIEKSTSTILKMFWAIIILLVGSIVAMATDIADHREPAPQTHSDLF